MFKVVLVDDEPSVLEGLRIFVDWDKMGFEVVGEASDGAASFSVICDKQPELVICDIRMPGLTGIELIEKVNASVYPPPKFILLSGYTDFSYAQKALQLGALGYLTKPLDGEEMARELAHAAGTIENERNLRQENLELIQYTANQLYNDIMDGKRDEKLSRKARLIFDISDNAKIRMVQFIADTGGEISNGPKRDIHDMLMRLTGVENENGIFYSGSGSYMIVMHDGIRAFTYHARLAEQLTGTLNAAGLKRYGLRAFWALISGVSGGEASEAVYTCGQQLARLQAYCMLHPGNHVMCYEALGNVPMLPEQTDFGDETALFPELPFDKIVSALKGNDAHAVSSAVDAFFCKLNQDRISRRLYAICLYRLADVVKKMAYAYGIEANRVVRNFTESVGAMNPNCKQLALDMCQYLFQRQTINDDKPWALLENEIIDYVKANCRKSLSLQTIAEKFSLPAMIISKIIKKKTGKKFNDYFNYLRIEYAKTLIASENMKITAICEESGYADYGYFIEKFKEFTGVSPSEYKKKYS